MGKPKITWTNDMTETLLSVRKTALAKKEKGDGRALMNIVLEHRQELFPNCKVTANALKIKLSKLNRGAESKVSTATETVSQPKLSRMNQKMSLIINRPPQLSRLRH